MAVMNIRLLTAVVVSPCWICPIVAAQAAQNDNSYIYLGTVKVTGQKQIVATLQAIKVGLKMPYSSDPKLANVVVCRLVDEADSHIKQWLICGTNRVLGTQRDALHLAMDVAVTAGASTGSANCVSAARYTRVFAALDQVLSSQRGNYLHTLVNGAALHRLLEQIPNTQAFAPSATPTSATTPVPAAATWH